MFVTKEHHPQLLEPDCYRSPEQLQAETARVFVPAWLRDTPPACCRACESDLSAHDDADEVRTRKRRSTGGAEQTPTKTLTQAER